MLAQQEADRQRQEADRKRQEVDRKRQEEEARNRGHHQGHQEKFLMILKKIQVKLNYSLNLSRFKRFKSVLILRLLTVKIALIL